MPTDDRPNAMQRPRVFQADLDLVRRAQSGGPRELEALASRFESLPRVVRALAARTGRRFTEEEVFDVAQDTIVRAWEKLDEFQGQSPLEGWIYGIARFELLNASRRRGSRARREDEFDGTARDAIGCEGVAEEFDPTALHLGLSKLDPVTALVVRLRHFDELSFGEIGARVGMTVNTVKTRYYRGLTRLQDLLRRDYGPEPLR